VTSGRGGSRQGPEKEKVKKEIKQERRKGEKKKPSLVLGSTEISRTPEGRAGSQEPNSGSGDGPAIESSGFPSFKDRRGGQRERGFSISAYEQRKLGEHSLRAETWQRI